MLSILIPTKDYGCSKLVNALHKQAEQQGCPFEIIVGEDGSTPGGLKLNAELCNLPNCRIIALSHNVGRAKIRNILAQEALHKNLLFIDSDAVVERDDFIEKYIETLKTHKVVCGGLYHDNELPWDDCTLRHKYEKRADKKRSAEIRSKNPHENFTTFNFAIRREIFCSIWFDEKIFLYGYEDTLFGHKLREHGIEVKHIDNPLLHIGLESNAVYLAKVEESIKTLLTIDDRIGETRLLKYANRIKKLHLTKTVALCWKIFFPAMRRNLIGKHPSLLLLNIYKLGYLCHLSLKKGSKEPHYPKKNVNLHFDNKKKDTDNNDRNKRN